MTQAELLILKNYVEAGNVLTTDMALRLIGSLAVAQHKLDKLPKQEEPKDETTPLRRAVQEWFQDIAPDQNAMLLGPADGDALDAAIVGIADLSPRDNVTVFVYDADKCISILATENEMSLEDAEEYFSFNTAGSYLGATTPIFVRRFPQPE
jgi:hypothetical protein